MNVGLIVYLVIWTLGVGMLLESWGTFRVKRKYGWVDLIAALITLLMVFWIAGWSIW